MTRLPDDLPISPNVLRRLSPEFRAVLQAVVDHYERRIAQLEARLNKTPQNSSLPPSSVHPHAKAARPHRESTSKRCGGQPGHEKHQRALIPTDECQHVETLMPARCRRCGRGLHGCDPQPLRHQVWELPEIRPIVTEYQRHRLACPCCRAITCAELPPGVPSGQSGARLTATVAVLLAGCRQSKRKAAWLCQTLFGIPCSPGLVVKLQNTARHALRSTYESLRAALPAQGKLNIDESPTKEGDLKSWLWTFVAPKFTLFAVRPTRAAIVLDEFLTDGFAGIIGCDRAKMYWSYGHVQWCWSHLKRDFQAMADSRHRRARPIGKQLVAQTARVFRQWRRFAQGLISWSGLRQTLARPRREVQRLLQRGFDCGHGPTQGTCTELLHHRRWLWTFVEHKGVEPTNNASERALRHGVIWRKLSFGTQSWAGSRFVETLLSVIETCRQQGCNVFEIVTDAVERHFCGQRPTPLLDTG